MRVAMEENKEIETEVSNEITESQVKNTVEVKEEISEEELTEDELYAKIQTEKLLRKRKRKKIGVLIGACVAFVFAFAIIVLSTVPVSMMPKCIESDFYKATIVTAGSTSRQNAFEKGEDGYNDFSALLNSSFKQTIMSSMFSGSLSFYDMDELSYYGKSTANLEADLNGTYYVRLQYETEKTLTNQNGKKYVSRYASQNSTLWDGSLTFKNAYITVNTEGGVRETKIYIDAVAPKIVDGEKTGDETRIVVVTVKADTSKIYDKWDELLSK